MNFENEYKEYCSSCRSYDCSCSYFSNYDSNYDSNDDSSDDTCCCENSCKCNEDTCCSDNCKCEYMQKRIQEYEESRSESESESESEESSSEESDDEEYDSEESSYSRQNFECCCDSCQFSGSDEETDEEETENVEETDNVDETEETEETENVEETDNIVCTCGNSGQVSYNEDDTVYEVLKFSDKEKKMFQKVITLNLSVNNTEDYNDCTKFNISIILNTEQEIVGEVDVKIFQ